MPNFVNPSSIVAQMGLQTGQTVADLGCGSGYYALAAAQVVGRGGTVYAIDVQDAKLAATQSLARHDGLNNLTILHADLEKPLLDIPEGSCDAVILASILHEVTSRDTLLQNAYRLLKTGGTLLAVDWKKELTPIGPDMSVRLDQETLTHELTQRGLRKTKDIAADPYHYATVFIK